MCVLRLNSPFPIKKYNSSKPHSHPNDHARVGCVFYTVNSNKVIPWQRFVISGPWPLWGSVELLAVGYFGVPVWAAVDGV